MHSEDYNGWSNYETWNVALWIQNDEGLYAFARCMRNRVSPYMTFAECLNGMGIFQTPDGVQYNDKNLDLISLDEMIEGL